MALKNCAECGYPGIFARLAVWNGDGTIITRDKFGLVARVTCLDVDETQGVFDGISKEIGMPVDHLLIEAQKSTGKAIYSMLPLKYVKRLPRSRFARPESIMKLVIKAASDEIGALGFGLMRLVEYRAGRSMTLEYENVCLVPRTVGGCLGFYESIETMPSATADYRVENGNLYLKMAPSASIPEAEQRLYLEEFKPGPGAVKFRRCDRCGVPLLASQAFEWRVEHGEIRNRQTGRREAVIAVQTINAIEREFERELGSEFRDMLYEAQKRQTLGVLQGRDVGGGNGFWKGYLLDMAMRGLGYPTEFSSGPSRVSLTIESAYNQELYAAKVAAALEWISGKPSSIEWKERTGKLGNYEIRV